MFSNRGVITLSMIRFRMAVPGLARESAWQKGPRRRSIGIGSIWVDSFDSGSWFGGGSSTRLTSSRKTSQKWYANDIGVWTSETLPKNVHKSAVSI